MKFLSVYKTTERGVPPSPEEMARMGKLVQEGMKAGYLLAVEGCMPTKLGVRVRQTSGQFTVTDGPFAETKEVICGMAILKADSKEQAIEYTKQFLSYAGADGECEVRQLHEAPAAADQQQTRATA
jgi:hypothetical protein